MELVFSEYGLKFNYNKTFYHDYEGESHTFIMDGYVISKVHDNFHYLGQLLFISPNLITYLYRSLKDIFLRIDALDCGSTVKLFLYQRIICFKNQ